MTFLRTIRLVLSVQLISVVVAGSTVAHDGAILLEEQTFSETIALGRSELPSFQHFSIAIANARQSSAAGGIAVPLELTTSHRGAPRSFILDATDYRRSEFALQLASARGEHRPEGVRLLVGLSGDNNPFRTELAPKIPSVKLFDSKFPDRDLAFVRFDINDWEVAEGLVSYDIKLSYWGKEKLDKPSPVLALSPALTLETAQ